jgi:hypothetical protein
MQDEAKVRVYVVEQQPFDYAPASAYGDILFMDVQKLAPDSPSAGHSYNSRILTQIRRELSQYVPGIDFIVPTGSPAKMLVVGAVLKEKGPTHNVLGWDSRTQRYLHYVVVI